MKEEEAKDLDDVLTILTTGKWNIMIFVLCSLSSMRMPPHVLSGAFVAPAVNYTCVAPMSDNTSHNITLNDLTQLPHSLLQHTATRGSQCQYQDPVDGSSQACTQWEYDTSVFTSTVTSQYNMVCDRSYLRSTYSSIYMFGAMFGSFIVGYLADWKGRKLVLTIGILGFSFIPLAMSWIPSLLVLLLCRFFMGFFHPILLTSFFTIALEVCEPKRRATVGILSAFPWAMGTVAWGGLAYAIRDWQWLNFAATLPCFLFIPCLWLIDESPRWLVVHGQHDRALAVLRRAAVVNGTKLPSEERLRAIMKYTQETAASNAKNYSNEPNKLKQYLKNMTILFSTRQLRLRTFVMWVLFFVASMVFYGLSLSAVSLSADPFVYMAVGGVMEMPGYLFTAPIIDYWGRKRPTSMAYLVCGTTILTLAFVPKDISWLVMTLAMMGKLAISMAYQIIYMYILELLPTEVRLQGLGSSMFASRIGSIMSPFITDNLGEELYWLPSAIFGSASLVAGFVTLLLPETNYMHMPDTVQDLEADGKDKMPQPVSTEVLENSVMQMEIAAYVEIDNQPASGETGVEAPLADESGSVVQVKETLCMSTLNN